MLRLFGQWISKMPEAAIVDIRRPCCNDEGSKTSEICGVLAPYAALL